MIEKAIEKIKAEMEKDKAPQIQIVGQYLLKQIEINKGAAIAIVQEGKTIIGSITEMEKVAKSKAVRGCGILTDAEGFEIVRKYFGFEAVQDEMMGVQVQEIKEMVKAPTEEVKPNKNKVEFKVDASSLFD